MDKDVSVCAKRNIHKRTEKEITDMVSKWEPTPTTQTLLDVRSLLQSAAITEVSLLTKALRLCFEYTNDL